MNTLYTKLEKVLKTDPRFVDADGDLFKNEIIDKAYKADQKLIEILISDKELEQKFFSKIKNHSIFNINDFVAYVQDKNFLNDSYTKFKNKIGLNIDGKFLNERKEVALVWPFKDCVLEGGMTKEDQKRKEIFFNEILAHDDIDKLFAPKVLTNWKRYTKNGEEAVKELKRDSDGTIRENLIIKGNNLVALHTLKTQFQGKVKLIYIDPPYNTGSDSFGYNDNFNHSTWLTFMKNRLEVAKELLRDDGVIFVQCDDSEQAYLKVILDDIYKRENFIDTIIFKTKGRPQSDAKWLSKNNDFIHLYAKNKEKWFPNLLERTEEMDSAYKNPDNDPKGPWASMPLHAKSGNAASIYSIKFDNGIIWTPPKGSYPRFSKETLILLYNQGALYFGGNIPRLKTYLSEVKQGRGIVTLWDDLAGNMKASSEIQALFGEKIFLTPKNEALLERIIQISTNESDIVLDYHLGSGTTAAVAHKMNRQYIGVEQMDYIENITVERLKKVIGGEQGGISKDVTWKGGSDFVYCELMKYNEGFIDQIESAKDIKALLKIWEQMKEKAFFKYSVDLKEFDASVEEFKKLDLDKQKEILVSLLNKNQMYVNLSEIDDKNFGVGKNDKELNNKFYE